MSISNRQQRAQRQQRTHRQQRADRQQQQRPYSVWSLLYLLYIYTCAIASGGATERAPCQAPKCAEPKDLEKSENAPRARCSKVASPRHRSPHLRPQPYMFDVSVGTPSHAQHTSLARYAIARAQCSGYRTEHSRGDWSMLRWAYTRRCARAQGRARAASSAFGAP